MINIIVILWYVNFFVCSFPYRGLVTGPWFEFGGKCPIECAKSGYVADIDFHCKVKIITMYMCTALDTKCVLRTLKTAE